MAKVAKRSWYMKTKFLFVAVVLGVAAFSLSLLEPLPLLSTSRKSSEEDEAGAEVVPVANGATGPESLAFDQDGEGPYTGVSDGRILKWQRGGWIEYAVDSPIHLSDGCKGSHDPEREHLCGRPLGLKFDEKTRNLYIADAYLGLLMVGPNEKLATPILTQAEGNPFKFTNSLDIDQDNGIIYFTDSSARFARRDYMSAVIARDNTGRLMKYDVRTKEVQVLLRGLYFPNGVLLGQDGSYVLVAETITCRILKYWLRPPKTGAVEVLVELPGFPDNIKRSPRGGFWVAMHSRRGKPLELLMSLLPRHWFGELLVRLPLGGLDRRIPSLVGARSLAMRVREEDGEVVEVMEGFGNKTVGLISEVQERNGTLWIGSVVKPFVAVYKLLEYVNM